jgi:MOSC domain-containing protein YiiM
MDAIRLGLKDELDGKRGMLAKVLNGGSIKVGDSVSVE